jgi:hypothetical protein
MNHPPSVLPWIARRNGLSLERAEELWRQAVAMADFQFGADRRDSEYWGYAVRALRKLAQCDGRALVDSETSFDGVPVKLRGKTTAAHLVEYQLLWGRLVFNTLEGALRIATGAWPRASAHRRAHPALRLIRANA